MFSPGWYVSLMGKGFSPEANLLLAPIPGERFSAPARAALGWVREQKDLLGLGIDAGVERPVAALRMFSIRTSQSCEGHADRALPFPWIDVVLEDYPRLERLLADNPLPGFAIHVGPSDVRLMPEGAVPFYGFSLLPVLPDGVEGVELQPGARAEQLSLLSEHRRRLCDWADRLLAHPAPMP